MRSKVVPRVVRSAVAALLLVALAGCAHVWPRHSPTEDGIPEARANAVAGIDDLRSRFHFSDRVVILGTGEADSCGAAHDQWFDDRDPGYRCWTTWSAVAVIPAARTSTEVVAAIDQEFERLDVPYPAGGAVRAFMSTYPRDRQPDSVMDIATGGHEGSIRLDVAAQTFRPEVWPPAALQVSTHGNVSGSGDASSISAEAISATGAIAVVRISLSTEYWNTYGLTSLDDQPPPDPVEWIHESWGSQYVLELADWGPVEGPWTGCLSDPVIDQARIVRVDEPFPYLRLDLLPDATDADLQRVRECILPSLTAGTLVTTDPYE